MGSPTGEGPGDYRLLYYCVVCVLLTVIAADVMPFLVWQYLALHLDIDFA
jgi:hypothetical protein